MINAKLLFVSVAFLTVASSASAEPWFTKVDEDVFSGKNSASMIGDGGTNGSLYFRCSAEGEMTLSVIFSFKEEMRSDIAGEIVVKVDANEVVKLDATPYTHNDDYGGFITASNPEVIGSLAKKVASSKGKILVGLAVPSLDLKQSLTITPVGSKKAAAQFIKACEIK